MEELLSRINVPTGLQFLVGSLAIVVFTIVAGWVIKALLFGVARSLTKRTNTDLEDGEEGIPESTNLTWGESFNLHISATAGLCFSQLDE